MQTITIKTDDLRGAKTITLLEAHRQNMFEHSPPECVFALDLDGLRQPEVTLWTAWQGDELLGCGALKELDAQQGEIKSMRTAAAHLRKGVAAQLLQHIIAVARSRGYTRLYLETGTVAAFAPARALYERHGFATCGPFADYLEDPYSVFMVLDLTDAAAMQSLLASGLAEPAISPFKLGIADEFPVGLDDQTMSELVITLRGPK